jgi:DNA-binding PadR family transcriptional regulator
MIRDFFLGFIKIHILYHASKELIYGFWLTEELDRHGYKLSSDTLYPVLRSLEEKTLLESYQQTVEGKIRKYYKITPKGKEALAEARQKIKELVREVIQ